MKKVSAFITREEFMQKISEGTGDVLEVIESAWALNRIRSAKNK